MPRKSKKTQRLLSEEAVSTTDNTVAFQAPAVTRGYIRWNDGSQTITLHLIKENSLQPYERRPDEVSFWYDRQPTWMYPLLDNLAWAIQEVCTIKQSKRGAGVETQRAIGFFLDFITGPHSPWVRDIEHFQSKDCYDRTSEPSNDLPISGEDNSIGNQWPHVDFPKSVFEIDRDVLIEFKLWLTKELPKTNKNASKNQRKLSAFPIWNRTVWTINQLLKSAEHKDKMHHSLHLYGVPHWRARHHEVTEPYPDLVSYQIIVAASQDCENNQHNYHLIHQIKKLKTGAWDNDNDFSWYLVNVIWEAKPEFLEEVDSGSARHWQERSSRKLITKQGFYRKYTKKQIREMAKTGGFPLTTPTATPCRPVLEKYNPSAQKIIAMYHLKRKFKKAFELQSKIESGLGDEKTRYALINAITGSMNSSVVSDGKRQQGYSTASLFKWAGFKGYENWVLPADERYSDHAYGNLVGLLIPTLEYIYPFFLFVHFASGVNQSALIPLARKRFSDLDPANVTYMGCKTKTGYGLGARPEEITTPKKELEPGGIDELLSHLIKATAPLVQYAPDNNTAKRMFLFLRNNTKRNEQDGILGPLTSELLRNCSKRFCKKHKIVTLTSGSKKEDWQIDYMESIDAKRVRETMLFAEYQDRPVFQDLQRAANDNSFDVVFKNYLNSKVQRLQNNLAIAAFQDVLINEMQQFEPEDKFQGELVLNDDDVNSPGYDPYVLNNCADKYSSTAPGQVKGVECCASFRACPGCKQSRVFSTHLPAIAFSVIQYQAKKKSDPVNWEAKYGHQFNRLIDCLKRWENTGDKYAKQVDEAWITAKSKGGVFLPPLN